MSKDFHNIKVGLDEELEDRISWLSPGYGQYRILRKSVDARQRHNPHLVYSIRVYESGENLDDDSFPLQKVSYSGDPVLIVGAGPAGLFAAIRLLERGIPVHLFERGSKAEKRILGINRFWRHGEFDPRNNVCYGEGGAGLYSDGKLITRIKSPFIPYVMQRLVKFGAPEEIKYLANPHVGSDKIRRIIPKIRNYIEELGGTIHFDTQVRKIHFAQRQVEGLSTEHGTLFRSPHVILATGHSAEDIIHELIQNEVCIEGKSFAIGLRIEHPRELINEIQYREFADHPKLETANYKLKYHNPETQRGIYSFCMCPGGYVLSSGSEADALVCNGMSNYNRNSAFSNSAIVVTIDHSQSFGSDFMGGLKFRRNLEVAALQQVREAGGNKHLPTQRLIDFFEQRSGPSLPSSCPSGVVPTRLDQLLPSDVYSELLVGLEKFSQSMKGFYDEKAQFHGVESRTSCPIRITRDSTTLESISHPGLYPTGEGAGYAGGITSAACDGIKVAEALVTKVESQAR
jgi:uncharacterized FAD-dependent dehydrogenase